MMKRKINYCSIDPKFPQHIYVASLFMLYNDKLDFLPLHQVFLNIKSCSKYISEVIDNIRNENNNIVIPDECALLFLDLSHKYPLKEEYWLKQNNNFKSEERRHLFIEYISNPYLHELLITPSFYDNKIDKWNYSATLPLKINESFNVIETFLMSSDVQVDERADSIAIYTTKQSLKYNWKKNEMEKINSPKLKILKN